MTKLPQIKPKDIEKILKSLNFVSQQGKGGSHVVFKHPNDAE